MTPAEFKEAIVKLYGTYGGSAKMAEAVGVDQVTISRQLNGRSPIRKAQAELIKLMLAGKHTPKAESMKDFL